MRGKRTDERIEKIEKRSIKKKKKQENKIGSAAREEVFDYCYTAARARYNLLAKSGRRGAREITSAFGVELHAHARTGVYIICAHVLCAA